MGGECNHAAQSSDRFRGRDQTAVRQHFSLRANNAFQSLCMTYRKLPQLRKFIHRNFCEPSNTCPSCEAGCFWCWEALRKEGSHAACSRFDISMNEGGQPDHANGGRRASTRSQAYSLQARLALLGPKPKTHTAANDRKYRPKNTFLTMRRCRYSIYLGWDGREAAVVLTLATRSVVGSLSCKR